MKGKGLVFRSVKHLVAWLRYHPAGECILGKIIGTRDTPKRPEPVVVELCSDGAVYVYGTKRVSVRVVVRPHVTAPQGGQSCDDYVELSLPRRHREVYAPGCVRAVGIVETLRPSDIVRRDNTLRRLELLETYDR